MSYSRPSKAERDRWAELLGDEKRSSRRLRIRVTAIVALALAIGGGFWFVSAAGISGSCPSNDDLKATWALKPAGLTDAERETAIEDTIRCVEMTGRTREAIQADIGAWTSVKEYKPATKSGRASFLVWSNGSKTPGVRVDFGGSKGLAVSAQRYQAS